MRFQFNTAVLPVAALLLLGACTTVRPVTPPAPAPAAPVTPPAPAISRAADLPLAAVPLRLTAAQAGPALTVFRSSCKSLQAREDRSGLTQAGDWASACAAAATTSEAEAQGFFQGQFTAVAVTPAGATPGSGFATGYYEPEIAGSRTPAPGFPVPLYKRPPDLIDVNLGSFVADWKGRTLRGKLEGTSLVPYADRGAIMAGALKGRGLELAWAADPYEAFFLEIQGSGRLRLPDGSIMRIGYAGQNGRDYVAIGRVLVERGDLPRGGASMDTILAWLRANPGKAPALLAANPSAVFFRELTGDGPIGAMGVAVTPGLSLAADPAFVPLGAPVLVETTLPGNLPLAALMVAQDTGGAIKGPNRVDLFRGAGAAARAEAGALAAKAGITLLLPRAAAARLLARP